MRIVVAPDSFKGTLSAPQVCQAIAKGINEILPTAKVLQVPLSDGGEGLVDTLVEANGGTRISNMVSDPLGRRIEATWGIIANTAVIEMASASGLPLLQEKERDPLVTSTYGTGELIKAALHKEVNRIIVGIGGSATNDGGAGMAQALGYRLLDEKQKPIPPGAAGLKLLRYIDCDFADPLLTKADIRVACDVTNPLTGTNGATYVYSRQKGMPVGMLPTVDAWMEHYGTILNQFFGREFTAIEGAGAAGGLGAGLMAFANAKLMRGIDLVLDAVDLEHKLTEAKVDLVITGEGKMDIQTANNKVPVGVSLMAKKYNIPVIAIVGNTGNGYKKVLDMGIDKVYPLVNKNTTIHDAIENAYSLVAERAKQAISVVLQKPPQY